MKLTRHSLMELVLTLLTLALMYGLFSFFTISGLMNSSTEMPETVCALTVYVLVIILLCSNVIGHLEDIGLYLFRQAEQRVAAQKSGRFLFRWASFFLRRAAYRIGARAYDRPIPFKLLGDIYFYGLAADKDWTKASGYYAMVLEANVANRSVLEKIRAKDGSVLESKTEPLMPECLANMDLIARSGQGYACLCLGLWHYDYHLPQTKVDPIQAAEYFCLALKLCEPSAKRLYALTILDNNFASPAQVSESIDLLEKDFLGGNLRSGLELGARYALGTAKLETDWLKAREYFVPLLANLMLLANPPRPEKSFSLRRAPTAHNFRRMVKYVVCRLAELYVELGHEDELPGDQVALLNQACSRSDVFGHIHIGPDDHDDLE